MSGGRALPPAHRAAERDARALVADPARAQAAGYPARRLAWAVLLSARGISTRQYRLVLMERAALREAAA